MKDGGRRTFEARKNKRPRTSSVSKKKNSSSSFECESFTGENEVSSPSPKYKKLIMSSSTLRVASDGAKWPSDVEAIFVDLMYNEVLQGNIYTTSFTPSVWKDIMNNLAIQCGICYSVKKLKSKHSRLKELWRKFHALMVAESGLGWDEVTNMPIASSQMWDQLIEKNAAYAEIRSKGCPHYLKLTTIFGGRTATGYGARASTQMPFMDNAHGGASTAGVGSDANLEGGIGASPMQPQSVGRNSSQNRRNNEDRGALVQILDRIADSSASSAALVTDRLKSLPECILQPLRELPGLTRVQWFEAIEFLENETRRRIFLAMTAEERYEYLERRCHW